MKLTGTGVNTVRIRGEVKHITELDASTLTHEWSKLKTENDDLYGFNRRVNQSWRGFISVQRPQPYPPLLWIINI